MPAAQQAVEAALSISRSAAAGARLTPQQLVRSHRCKLMHLSHHWLTCGATNCNCTRVYRACGHCMHRLQGQPGHPEVQVVCIPELHDKAALSEDGISLSGPCTEAGPCIRWRMPRADTPTPIAHGGSSGPCRTQASAQACAKVLGPDMQTHMVQKGPAIVCMRLLAATAMLQPLDTSDVLQYCVVIASSVSCRHRVSIIALRHSCCVGWRLGSGAMLEDHKRRRGVCGDCSRSKTCPGFPKAESELPQAISRPGSSADSCSLLAWCLKR